MSFKEKVTTWYNEHVVKGWYKTWTVWAAVLAAALPSLPDLLQLIVDHLDTISLSIPKLDDTLKQQIRFGALIVIPFLRATKQKNLPPAA